MDPKLFFPASSLLFTILILTRLPASSAQDNEQYSNCGQLFTCGNIAEIGYPFWGGNRLSYCGHPSFNLDCSGAAPLLTIETRPYRILSIDNTTYALKVVREEFWNTSCPQYVYNATLDVAHFDYMADTEDLMLYYGCTSQLSAAALAQFTCLANGTAGTFGIYGLSSVTSSPFVTGISCNTTVSVRVNQTVASLALVSSTAGNVTEVLVSGIGLTWQANNSDCEACVGSGGRCGWNTPSSDVFACYCADQAYPISCGSNSTKSGRSRLILILITGASAGVGIFVILVLCITRKHTHNECTFFWKKKQENYRNVEAYLKNCGSLSPKRYTYSEVKKMTNSFRVKLGQGGYGFVFKGKLENGCLVAVKVLKGLKGNGEEFINEVATISRTSHVNIVNLLGFCFDGRHRALIYKFMPNGSLEKFIHDVNSSAYRQLGWESTYQIAVGIARGLEYLHRGCNTRILHFDIKPHNILLDEDFCPKISDFGLAKLCPEKESIISLLGARGTFGYIAPEVFCRNFGGVSHKSDVYSYGIMVLEMVGGRKNISVEVDTSEIYFPHWIYDRIALGEELGLHGIMNNEANESAKKMIVAGLWCIQTDPSHRPSMSRVVNMLEGSLVSLPIPPKPYLSSPSRPRPDSSATLDVISE